MESLSVSMAVGSLLQMDKNEGSRFVQTVPEVIAFNDYPENLCTIFCLGQVAGEIQTHLVLRR
jgi:hypothetical protein